MKNNDFIEQILRLKDKKVLKSLYIKFDQTTLSSTEINHIIRIIKKYEFLDKSSSKPFISIYDKMILIINLI